jgi:hypothetical protein
VAGGERGGGFSRLLVHSCAGSCKSAAYIHPIEFTSTQPSSQTRPPLLLMHGCAGASKSTPHFYPKMFMSTQPSSQTRFSLLLVHGCAGASPFAPYSAQADLLSTPSNGSPLPVFPEKRVSYDVASVSNSGESRAGIEGRRSSGSFHGALVIQVKSLSNLRYRGWSMDLTKKLQVQTLLCVCCPSQISCVLPLANPDPKPAAPALFEGARPFAMCV